MNLRTSFMMALALIASAPVQALDDSTRVLPKAQVPKFGSGDKAGGWFRLKKDQSLGGFGGYLYPVTSWDVSIGPDEGELAEWFDYEGWNVKIARCAIGNWAASNRCQCPPADPGYYWVMYSSAQHTWDNAGTTMYAVDVNCFQLKL
jgi:hypothetical protein